MQDKDKIVEVKDGKLKVNDADFTVKWTGAFTDGIKKIVSVENKHGGEVLLDDGTVFRNPLLESGQAPDNTTVDVCGAFDAILRLCILCQDRSLI